MPSAPNVPTKYQIVGDQIVITFPIVPRKSKSGKSMLLASTGGAESFVHEGKEVKVNLNVYVLGD
tara:strand:- start:1189 stop:1383 length:195 start_codon:yes stop_codon:yes gene_type:complete